MGDHRNRWKRRRSGSRPVLWNCLQRQGLDFARREGIAHEAAACLPQRKGIAATADDRRPLNILRSQLLGNLSQDFDVATCQILGLLGVCQPEPAAAVHDEIHLLCAISPEVDVPAAALVDLQPAQLPEHQGLPERSRQR